MLMQHRARRIHHISPLPMRRQSVCRSHRNPAFLLSVAVCSSAIGILWIARCVEFVFCAPLCRRRPLPCAASPRPPPVQCRLVVVHALPLLHCIEQNGTGQLASSKIPPESSFGASPFRSGGRRPVHRRSPSSGFCSVASTSFAQGSVVEDERKIVVRLFAVELQLQLSGGRGKRRNGSRGPIAEGAHRRPDAQRSPQGGEVQGARPQSTNRHRKFWSFAHIDRHRVEAMKGERRHIDRGVLRVAHRKTVDEHGSVRGAESASSHSHRGAESAQ